MTEVPTPPAKPLPIVNDENRPFWAAAARGELSMQRCLACGHIRFPIQALCPRCLAGDVEWTVLCGRAEILAKVVYHRAFHPAYAQDVPYNLVLVQLAEGPRMFGNVVGADGLAAGDGAGAVVGDQVEAVFEPVADGLFVPRFRKIGAN
ncbi:MAG TPA: OB-fold domain-containing protein [Trebonia sp.]|nr:OB-fold domain-containing protein [Trebonia sp.]